MTIDNNFLSIINTACILNLYFDIALLVALFISDIKDNKKSKNQHKD